MNRLMHRSNYLLYSIPWSARSRNDSGIVRPSALAALRFMTSSNLVGVSTGSSLGRAPPENSVDQKQRTDNEGSCLAAGIIHEEGCTRPARRGRPRKLSSRRLRGARLVGLQA